MSNNPGEAATTAREQETEQTHTSGTGQDTQDAQSPAFEQQTGNTPPPSAERQTEIALPGTHHPVETSPAESEQATGTQASETGTEAEPRAQTGEAAAGEQPSPATITDNQAQAGQSSETNAQTQTEPSSITSSPVESAASPATAQPTGEPDEGVANSANVEAAPTSQEAISQEATRREFEPRPDVSDQGWRDLMPKLLALFNNNREQLARAIGLHRSTVDRWLNGKSRPNNSTILRMRRLAQERNIE